MEPLTPAIRRARARWRWVGRGRPDFAVAPGPGQESVWDYPRPPRIEPDSREVRVELAGEVVAASRRALRVLETAAPPTVYVPREDVEERFLVPSDSASFCEWKGRARQWTLRVAGRTAPDAAWEYPDPFPEFTAIRDHLAFHAGRVDACTFGGERVVPQPGRYYGGWITSELVGPFKGDPGSEGW